MRRRTLIGGVTATLGGRMAFARGADSGEGGAPSRDVYELRSYHVRIGDQKAALDEWLKGAAVPAWNRAGVRPVGVFETMVGPEVPKVHVLLTHSGMESVAALGERLAGDGEYLAASAAFRERPPAAAAYDRYETTILRAFPNVPRIEIPPAALEGRPRVFELRTYESHSEAAHEKKMEMFTRLGELEIFRRTGLTPVFFGKTLAGRRLPNFVYMLTWADLAAREQAWRTFIDDPEWKKLARMPGYTDPEILSNISNLLLRPAPSSQV